MRPLTLIAAVAENGVIGRDNALLWRLKGDMAHFRAATLGKPCVMGRRTFESLGRPLPKRLNVVASRKAGLALAGAVVAQSLEAAIEAADNEGARSGGREIMILGGADLYAQTLPRADRLLITHVAAAPAGDAAFPAIDPAVWEGVTLAETAADATNAHAFRIVDYRRRRA